MDALSDDLLARPDTILPLYSGKIYNNKLLLLCPTLNKLVSPKICDFSYSSGHMNQFIKKTNYTTDKEEEFIPVERKQKLSQKPINKYTRGQQVTNKQNNNRYNNKNTIGGVKKDKYALNSKKQNTNYSVTKFKSRTGLSELAVEVPANACLVHELPLQTLSGIIVDTTEVKIEDLKWCGRAYKYKKSIDNTIAADNLTLDSYNDKEINIEQPDTKSDEILCELIEDQDINVIITSQLLGTLMCSSLSKFSWQVVCYKFENKLIFNKPDTEHNLDLLNIGECNDGISDIKQKSSAIDAAKIQIKFQNYCLDLKTPTIELENKNSITSTAYGSNKLFRYRKVIVPPRKSLIGHADNQIRKQNLIFCIRAEIHAVGVNQQEEINEYINIHTLTEGLLKSQPTNWTEAISKQKGQLIIQEMKYNSNIINRWIINSIVAGATNIRIGLISHKQNNEDVVLFVYKNNIPDFIIQSGIKLKNKWGTIREICDLILSDGRENGKYYITRDALTPNIKIHYQPIDDELTE